MFFPLKNPKNARGEMKSYDIDRHTNRLRKQNNNGVAKNFLRNIWPLIVKIGWYLKAGKQEQGAQTRRKKHHLAQADPIRAQTPSH
jgi:hypothetical protein